MSPQMNLVGIQITEQEKKTRYNVCAIAKQDNEEVIELYYRICDATLVVGMKRVG